MKFRKEINKNGYTEYSYNEKLKVLSPISAYRAMIKFLDEIYLQDKDIELGELISELLFNGAWDTDYSRSWEIWEKVVREELAKDKSKEEVRSKKD